MSRVVFRIVDSTVPVSRLVPAELYVGPLVPVGQPGLGHLNMPTNDQGWARVPVQPSRPAFPRFSLLALRSAFLFQFVFPIFQKDRILTKNEKIVNLEKFILNFLFKKSDRSLKRP